jgi:hypothetical protein
MPEYTLDQLFATAACGTRAVVCAAMRRRSAATEGARLELDQSTDGLADCLFLRAATATRFRLDGDYRLLRCAAGGWLLHCRDSTASSYWLPAPAMLRRTSAQGHILEEQAAELDSFDLDSSGVAITFAPIPEGWTLDAVVWQLNDAALLGELQTLAPNETQGYFLLGSHTRYGQPANLYRHLIHGWVYEDRYAWPHKRRICSENDAHALHLVFSGLQRATGKRVYGLLKTQLLLSVLSRQGEDGGFRHGEWSENMESHYRLHASGMHLMMDHLAEGNDPSVANALAWAADFLASRPDNTELGTWFLHDDLEQSTVAMQQNPFTWIPSRVLGKSPSNMLVLNTHLDTLIGLDRFREQSGGAEHNAGLIYSAVQAANKVIALRPAETLYRIASIVLYLTFLPTVKAAKLPLYQRAIKRIGWKWLAPHFHHLKTAFPRLVMPGGYIDRAISIKGVSDAYQSINLMDLLRYLRRFPNESVTKVTQEALTFTRNSGILERWAEISQKEYALGFWAEALWHACTLFPDACYRTWLAEAMLTLEAKDMGLPPSLLGANAEAIAPSEQHPCPIPVHPSLRVANLSRCVKQEYLVVNPTNAEIELTWANPLSGSLQWQDAASHNLKVALKVPAHSWLHGKNG